MKNYDRIKNMSVEEMSEFIASADYCDDDKCTHDKTGKYFCREEGACLCDACVRDWLESEVEE